MLEIFTLLAILGLLGTVAVAVYLRFSLRARASEAAFNLQNIANSAMVYYEVSQGDSKEKKEARLPPSLINLSPGFCAEHPGGVCPAGWNGFVLFRDEPTFQALHFNVGERHFFTYTWLATGSGDQVVGNGQAEAYLLGPLHPTGHVVFSIRVVAGPAGISHTTVLVGGM